MKKVLIFLLTLLLTINITVVKAEEKEYNGENLLPGVIEKTNELLLKVLDILVPDEDAAKESKEMIENNSLEKMMNDGYTIYYRIKKINDDQIAKAVELSETKGQEDEKTELYYEIVERVSEDTIKKEFTKTDTPAITLPELTKGKGYLVTIYATKVENGGTSSETLPEIFQATSDKTLRHVDIFKNTDFNKLTEEEIGKIENNSSTTENNQKSKTSARSSTKTNTNTKTSTNQNTQENQQVTNAQTSQNPTTGLKEYLLYLTPVILIAGIFLATKKSKVFQK